MDVSKMSDADRLSLAKQLADNLRDGLEIEIKMASFTLKSKLPVKVSVLREALLHRMSDIADVAAELYEKDRRVSAFIQTRAAVETVAMLFRLEKKCRDFLDNWDVTAFDDFLMRALMGSKDKSTPMEALQILKAVDNANKEYPDFRKMYDTLCEFTHPNWSGVIGTYANIDQQNFTAKFGKEIRKPPLAYGLGPLIGSLTVFAHHYNELASVLKTMNDRFDAQT